MSEKQAPQQKSALREWWDSIIFAVVAATIIRWLVFDPYTIPTPSMENSLMVGDFLFVSRLHYGTRTPQTPIQMPLTHQTWWGTQIKSYSDIIQLPIFRLPGFSSVKNNDVVVFNWPGDYGTHPTDLRTNYIKRCIAISGDVLEIKDRQVYINGKAVVNPPRLQTEYFIKTDKELGDTDFRTYGIVNDYRDPVNPSLNWQPAMVFDSVRKANVLVGYRLNTTPNTIEEIKKNTWCKGVEVYSMPAGETLMGIYGASDKNKWNVDNFGPLQIPKEGQTIELTPDNIAKYGMVIERYEGNKQVELSPTSVKIEGKPITTYTFKQNYYFMMGDNRHNSLDSRFWGFVPADHIVGKAVFVWMSLDPNPDKWYNKIRWNRIFRTIE
jgi:signal peptidase I